MIWIIMGVAGSGKTTVGRRLADRLGIRFHDADDLHPPPNIDKMSRGEPLTDEDRRPWLERIRSVIDKEKEAGRAAVIACSALKESYRRALGKKGTTYIYLKGEPSLFLERLKKRLGHFMPPGLLASQFQDLEEPTDAITVDAALPVNRVVEQIERKISEATSGEAP